MTGVQDKVWSRSISASNKADWHNLGLHDILIAVTGQEGDDVLLRMIWVPELNFLETEDVWPLERLHLPLNPLPPGNLVQFLHPALHAQLGCHFIACPTK